MIEGRWAVGIWTMLLCAALGYLCGNLQSAIIISKGYYHDDVRRYGSGNAGSTNMVRVFGYGPGAITFAGDFFKAMAGVLLGRFVCGTVGGYVAGLFVVAGHCWPAFAGLRGGKGVACSAGVALLCFPLGAAAAFGIGLIVFALKRRMSLMSLTSLLLFFIAVMVFRRQDIPLVGLSALLMLIVYVRHIENIRRLLHGEEGRLKREGREP